jgi:hypothetical protein
VSFTGPIYCITLTLPSVSKQAIYYKSTLDISSLYICFLGFVWIVAFGRATRSTISLSLNLIPDRIWIGESWPSFRLF